MPSSSTWTRRSRSRSSMSRRGCRSTGRRSTTCTSASGSMCVGRRRSRASYAPPRCVRSSRSSGRRSSRRRADRRSGAADPDGARHGRRPQALTMRTVELIERKRDDDRLSTEELAFLVDGYTKGDIPDYQMAAFCMAVVWRGMDRRETADLTAAMVASGERLDLRRFGRVVDKHSTGGVGDKTTLVVAPLVAACGLPVGEMTGRGLGFSGGTLDKLESFTGYRVDLTTVEFLAQLERIGIVVTGQTKELAPADGLLYALRDATGTVSAIPLIASSIMSKKIAAGAHAVVLDVKVGSGAFMK